MSDKTVEIFDSKGQAGVRGTGPRAGIRTRVARGTVRLREHSKVFLIQNELHILMI